MKFIIEPYQPDWMAMFLSEEKRIHSILEDFNPTIEHIGSTSVKDLGAKPIIDILVGLTDETMLDKTIVPMLEAGYTYMKMYTPAWPGRRFFVKLQTNEKPTPSIIDDGDDYIIGKDFISSVHVHIIVKDTNDWFRHIAFREFLKTHRAVKDEYYELKKNISTREYRDMNEYNDAKDNFIKQTEQLALEWYYEQGYKNRVIV